MGIKILLVHSLPTGAQQFRFDRKCEALARRLSAFVGNDIVSLTVAPATCAERLGQLVARVRPDLFHVVCHGAAADPRVLLFEDRHGRRHSLDAVALQRLFHDARVAPPQLTVLEACQSRSIGEALVTGGFPYVVGMEHDVDPHHGTHFFGSFHVAVARGKTIEAAFAEARRDLELLAPGAADTPVLCHASDRALAARLVPETPKATRHIKREHEGDQVFLSSGLTFPAVQVVGHDDELAALTTLAGRRGIVQVCGHAGSGKTLLLRRWLQDQAARQWSGSARVFTWSFDAFASGPGCGDVHAFLEEALFFLGGHTQSELTSERADSAWIRGLRVGRLLRQEASLLVLDAVPTLPRSADAARSAPPEQLLHPALAAVLREIEDGDECRCILAIDSEHDRLALAGSEEAATVELRGLRPDEGATLLWHHGMLDDEAALGGLAEVLQGHPLALVCAARNFLDAAAARKALAGVSAGSGNLESPGPIFAVLRAIETTPASIEILSALAFCDGTFELEGLERAARGQPVHGALRPLVRGGLVQATRGGNLHLVHRSLLPGLRSLPVPASAQALVNRASDDVRRSAGVITNLSGHARLLRLFARADRWEEANTLYIRDICRVDSEQYQHSYITRDLGLIAEDIELLANFFRRVGGDPAGGMLWGVPKFVAPSGEAVDLAFLCHRAGLAWRHLGHLAQSLVLLQKARDLYEERTLLERAATCANDHAETLVLLADHSRARGQPVDELLASAAEFADTSVKLADAHARSVGSETRKDVVVVRTLCVATRGHVHHHRGASAEARRDFDAAQALAQRAFGSCLGSRPGFQHWQFLLDEIPRARATTRAAATPAMIELALQLDEASQFHQGEKIAAVSRGLEELVRGRLATLFAERGQPYPKISHRPGKAPAIATPTAANTTRLCARRRALISLGTAIEIFRANQHLWMLPMALEARAELREEVLQDTVNARLDRADATRLRGFWAA